MSIDALRRLRERFPQYRDLSDQELARRVIVRYPQYRDLLGDVAGIPSAPRGTYLSGGLSVGSIFDMLRTGEYAVGGLMTRRPDETRLQAARRGVITREESAPRFAEYFQSIGAPDSFATDTAAFIASLVVDPINLIGLGVPGKTLRLVGATRAAAAADVLGAKAFAPARLAAGAIAERVAPGAVRAAQARRAIEPILERRVIQEAGGVERVIDLGQALRQDAIKLAGDARNARRLDQAVGMYFDAGADTMLNSIAQAVQGAEQAAGLARREAFRRQAGGVGLAARVSAEAVRQTAAETIQGIQGSVSRALQVSGWLDEATRLRAIDAATRTASRMLSEAGTFANQATQVLREAIGTATTMTGEAVRVATERATFVASQAAADIAARGLSARQAEQVMARVLGGELRAAGVSTEAVDQILRAYQRTMQAVGAPASLRRIEVMVADALRAELKSLGTNDRVVRDVVGNFRKLVSPITRGRTQEMASLAAQGVRATIRRASQEAESAVRAIRDIPTDPETIARARQAGQRAQQEWLRQQPASVRAFVERWAPRLAEEDKVLGEGLVRVGMIRPETAAKWEGFHLRKIYRAFEDPAEFIRFLEQTDPVRAAELLSMMERGVPFRQTGALIPTGVAKARKLPSAERAGRLQEIYQASSRYVAGGTMAERAIARGEAFQKVAQQFAPPEHIARMLAGADEATAATLGWRRMPSTTGWGALAERWVPKEIHDILIAAEKRPEGLEKAITTLVGWFKFSKVILNPATHARNIRTNVALIHNAVGLGGMRPDLLARAFKEVVTNGQAFREAKGVSSAFVNTFTNTEITRFVGDFDRARGPLEALAAPFRKVFATAARAYEVEEQVGKMAVYLTMRNRGATPEAAAKLAEVALFNYGKVPPLIEKARRLGFYPFATFPYKVATQTLPQVLRRPGRAAQQAKLAGLVSTEPGAEEARVLPREMRGGNFVRVPWKDAHGRPLYYDITYEYYFGDIGESGTPPGQLVKLLRGEAQGWEGALEALAPLLTPVGQIIAELRLNKSIFTGQELRRKGETLGRGAGRQVARTALPGWVFATGEAALAKAGLEPEPVSPLARAVTGTVTRMGTEPHSVPQALAHTFAGVRVVPLDVAAQKRTRLLELQGAIRDTRIERASIRNNPNYARQPELRKRKLDELNNRLRKQIDEYRKEGAIKRR